MELPCVFCEKTFKKNFDHAQHVRSHTKEKPFMCPVCGVAFTQKSNMKTHVERRHGRFQGGIKSLEPSAISEKNVRDACLTYSCQFCTDKFSSYHCLRRHLANHKTEKLFQCEAEGCKHVFKSVAELILHAQLSHPRPKCGDRISDNASENNASRVKCKMCHRLFRNAASLHRHESVDNHQYKCSLCEHVSTSERYLRKHLTAHSGLPCGECQKVFASQKSLSEHSRIHNGSDLYFCGLCGLKFCSLYRLRRHVPIHFRKELACPYREKYGCEKRFYRKDKLRDHVKSHEPTGPSSLATIDRDSKSYGKPVPKTSDGLIHMEIIRFEEVSGPLQH